MALPDWVRLPTRWIEDGGLRRLRWKEQGSTGTAALMLLLPLAHRVDQSTGSGSATYDELSEATELSRTKISEGLALLQGLGLIQRDPERRSGFTLLGFGPNGWGKLPAKRLYVGKGLFAFREFHLRKYVELNALKLYLLVVARRDTKTNLAHLTYDQIAERSGIDPSHIRSAISLLAAAGLMHIERVPSLSNEFGVANAYRLTYLDSFTHMGTSGRKTLSEGSFFAATDEGL